MTTKKEEIFRDRSQAAEESIDIFDPQEYVLGCLKQKEPPSSLSSSLAIISESSRWSSSSFSSTAKPGSTEKNYFYSLSSVEAADFLDDILSLFRNILDQYLFLIASVNSLSIFPSLQPLFGRFQLFVIPFFSIIVSVSLSIFSHLFMVFPQEMVLPVLPKVESFLFLSFLLFCCFL
jgi:hypothetical protein